jgi:hypothetical protein
LALPRKQNTPLLSTAGQRLAVAASMASARTDHNANMRLKASSNDGPVARIRSASVA